MVELSKFVREILGAKAWLEVTQQAGVLDLYQASEVYDDRQMELLLEVLAVRTGKAREALLNDFGEYIAAPLLEIASGLIPDYWQLFDLLENTEDVIHHVVRLRDPKADPPRLRVERRGTTEVTIYYDSPRRMCWLGKGIIKAMARRYAQRVSIEDVRCMGSGDALCEIRVSSLEYDLT